MRCIYIFALWILFRCSYHLIHRESQFYGIIITVIIIIIYYYYDCGGGDDNNKSVVIFTWRPYVWMSKTTVLLLNLSFILYLKVPACQNIFFFISDNISYTIYMQIHNLCT